MMSLCYAAVLLFSAPANAPGQSEGMVVELKALEARQALRNGTVELTVEYLKEEGGPPGAQQVPTPSMDLKIHFDGKRRFVEIRQAGLDRPIRRMFDESTYYVEDGSSAERLTIDSRGLAGSTYLLFDPRLLGVYPLTFPALASNPHSLDEVLGRTDRTDEQVTMEPLSGLQAIRVFRKHLAGQVHESLWIVPEWNHSVAKVELVVPSTNSRIELLSEYDKPFGKVWFPRRTTLREYHLANNQLIAEEVVTVKSAVFNQGVAPSLFTLAAFKLEVGDQIRQDGAQMAWNGTKLIPAHDAAERHSQPSSLISRWSWFAVSTFLVIAAFVMLRVRQTPNLFAKGAKS